jgi:hypothetical protein
LRDREYQFFGVEKKLRIFVLSDPVGCRGSYASGVTHPTEGAAQEFPLFKEERRSTASTRMITAEPPDRDSGARL